MQPMSEAVLLIDREAPIATVTLNRPDRTGNPSLSRHMLATRLARDSRFSVRDALRRS